LKEDCWKRQGIEFANETVRVCGEGCVLGENGSCVNVCNNEKHYKIDEIGKCVIKDCEERIYDNSLGRVCGTSCYKSEESEEGCRPSCSNQNHYEANIKGICIEKTCLSRIINEKKENGVCGSGFCYGKEKEDEEEGLNWEGSCVEECTNPKFNLFKYSFNSKYILLLFFLFLFIYNFFLAPTYLLTRHVLFVLLVKFRTKTKRDVLDANQGHIITNQRKGDV
jgi:hypothetical protein